MPNLRIDNFNQGISSSRDRGPAGSVAFIRGLHPAWYGGLLAPNPPYDTAVWTGGSFTANTHYPKMIVATERSNFLVFGDNAGASGTYVVVQGGSSWGTTFGTDIFTQATTTQQTTGAVAAHGRVYYGTDGLQGQVRKYTVGGADAQITATASLGQFYHFTQNNNVYYIDGTSAAATLSKIASDASRTADVFVFPAYVLPISISEWGQYLAVLCAKPTGQYQLWLWDTYSDGPNAIINLPVTQGQINNKGTLINLNGTLLIIAGPRASIFTYRGGMSVTKVWQVPAHLTNNDVTKEIVVDPNARAVWRNMAFFGLQSSTTNGVISNYLDIFTIGSSDVTGSELAVHSFDNLTTSSSGNAVNFQGVTAIASGGDKLLVGGAIFTAGSLSATGVRSYNWGAAGTYIAGTLETLIIPSPTNLRPDQKISVQRVGLETEPLGASDSLTLKYQEDRDGTWRTLMTMSGTNAVEQYIDVLAGSGIDKTIMKDIQFQLTWTNTSATSPRVKAIMMQYDIVA